MGIREALNTHTLYKTVNHEHLDSLVNWAMNDFPDSGINLVECQDGRWFVEVDHGEAFNQIEGISKPDIQPYREPRFFSSEDGARQFAYTCLRHVYPDLEGVDLDAYYSDDE